MASKKKSTKATSAKVKSTKLKTSAKKAIKKTAVKKSQTGLKKAVAKKPTKKALVKKNPEKKPKPVITKKIKAVTKTVKKKTVVKKAAAKSNAIIKKAAKKVVAKKIQVKSTTNTVPKVRTTTTKETAPVKTITTPIQKQTAPVVSTEKFVKIGVKTKKQLIAIPPQPVIEVSNYPKNKVKTILISQPKPESDKNPYYDLSKKYSLIETFRQFIKIEGLPVKDFRAQRIDILEHKAVILTSRMAVDHYFRMCNEMRVTVPESMKYFCINEATAYYLQKYIQYRKRKIFFGHQTIQDLVDVIRKNKEEKFLLPAADVHKEQICDFLDALDIKYTKAVMYRTVSADLSDIKNLNDYDMLVFFTPAGINSLKFNFPNFKQDNTRIACFGAATANTLKKHGYRLDVYAPNPKNPSMTGALDEYIKEANKR